MAFFAVAVFLLATSLVALGSRRGSSDPRLRFFRCLLPSWRFFESVEVVPVLSFRSLTSAGEAGPWLDAIPPRDHRPAALLYNPEGNLRLAAHGVVEQLFEALAEQSPIALERAVALSSFRLAQRVVLVLQAERLPPGTSYQLRLSTLVPEQDRLIEDEELLVSPPYVA